MNPPSAPELPNHLHSLVTSPCIIISRLRGQGLAHSRLRINISWMEGWMEGWMDAWTDRRTDGPMDEDRALCLIRSIP